MHTLNLGILAHVDAGKTSLTERLLHAAGVIDTIGRVDDGSTQTDSMSLERQRGITIKSAVASFVVDDVTVNLIDTPGHPDFIAEVERVLNVLDGAVLVISAVEGVQAQTRVLMRTLQRLGIPTLIFVNKIDRSGAQYDDVLRSIAEKLAPASISMGPATALGTRGATSRPYNAADADFRSGLVDLLTGRDEALLAAYVDDEAALSCPRLRGELAAQTKRALVHPVFFGSAITGAGVDALISGITELLPTAEDDADGPVSGTVFKVERGSAGEKIAYVRMFSGTVRVRDRLPFRGDEEGKVTALSVYERGSDVPGDALTAGQIGKLWGIGDVRIGDAIGVPRATRPDGHHFAPPTLETIVAPLRPADKGALHVALTQLAEQDPLINLRQDGLRQETSVSLYGEVQKEVIQATLANDFGVDVAFRETTTIHIERPVGTGAAAEFIHVDPNPFLATVGLRIDPAPVGSGVGFRLEVELGSMPYSFFKAVEETVRTTLEQGIHGWQVTDCTVTMTHSGYAARQSHAHAVFDKSMSSTAGDFRNLTPLVLMSALQQAVSRVYEPMHRFGLDIPADMFGLVLPVLARLRAVPQTSAVRGSSYVVEGEIPAASVHALERQMPSLTRGEGVLECAFDHYQPVCGAVPDRPRSDHDPLHRREYLMRVTRRAAGG
ncbi:TetM/TetW/TetO/TetS family tetracycline resistance ribosomal protection protein [Streptomyces sp. So13.3]|uniref:elongation factor G n=1 Tax=Streptomyces TaxID=1883 RepID=UPI001107290C|nr:MULTISPECIES: TetM/TetW/TetO/TetS family tetracycline resistance ribosomal protection protein [Streptomyces]MCZ4096836.1 TetM/TetW/TetO/TetS family tetracycline resistance ribosomal protection protein [Streptomyces sp. H39-C1]QNA77084.1 TetM/TetW/TetO/TetS family tetracycline resistance ribosomal protection protein [Streptomyces sp. So13.3]